MILKFNVKEQTVSLVNTKSVPRIGSKDYLVLQFSFSSDWANLNKLAYLQNGDISQPIDVVDNLVEVPEWFTEQNSFNVTLFGTDGTTEVPTNVVSVQLEKSNDLWVKDSPEPTPSWIIKLIDLSNHPPIPGSNGFWMLWDVDKGEYVESQLPLPEATTGGTGGTTDHSKLSNRDADDQHPMRAITGLEEALEGKQTAGDYLTQETDPTVPAWAKEATKPSYTASEVGADPSGTAASQVAAHNTGTDAHSDIRLLISGLTGRLNALADSDDTTLDQLSEIVEYIKSNRDLISSITTSKVNVADIVNDLVTNVSNKPLSAAQGVALKALIDAISVPDKLPNPNALTFTGAVTGSYDGSAPLTVEIPSGGSGGGGGASDWDLIAEITSDGAGTTSGLYCPINFADYKELHIEAIGTADSGITFRLIFSNKLAWYDGQGITTTTKSTNLQMHTAHCWIIGEFIKVIAGTASGYSLDSTGFFINNPRYAFATSDYAYIRFDANNSVVPEGATLKVWGLK